MPGDDRRIVPAHDHRFRMGVHDPWWIPLSRPDRRHCALTQQVAPPRSVTSSRTLGRRQMRWRHALARAASGVSPGGRGRCGIWAARGSAVGLPVQAQKSMVACGSAVAPQNSVTLPSRMWLTFATGTSIDLLPREADSVHSATACSSLASTS